MSRTIFCSYSRVDGDQVAAMCADLEEGGYTTWRDQRLTGGQDWWETILGRIRETDIVIVAVSAASLKSVPCMREVGYAEALGKTIVPVLMSSDAKPRLAPPSLARREWVDYRAPNRSATIRLFGAISSLPDPGPLPDPLPPPPEVPISYMSDLAVRVRQAEPLPAPDQRELLFTLRRGLQDEADRAEICDLLVELRGRPEILAVIASDVDDLLAQASAISDRLPPPIPAAADSLPTPAVSNLPPPPPSAASQPSGAGDGSPTRRRGVLVAALVAAVLVIGATVVVLVARSSGGDPFAYGDDATLDALWNDCRDDDFGACDRLFAGAPGESEYQRYGSSCGDVEGATSGGCADLQRRRTELRTKCEEGDYGGCDELSESAHPESEDRQFGTTCGERVESSPSGGCAAYFTTLDDAMTQCRDGDWASCDELWQTAPEESTQQDFGATCGDWVDVSDLNALHDEGTISSPACVDYVAALDSFWTDCDSGDLTACDLLYYASPEDTDYRDFGASCGQRVSLEGLDLLVEYELIESALCEDYASGLDSLWETCAAGGMAACDVLYQASPSDSDYEVFGSTCGERSASTDGKCGSEPASTLPAARPTSAPRMTG